MSSLSSASHAIRHNGLSSRIDHLMAIAPAATTDAGTDFRQLRHQTKNALQRLLCEIARVADRHGTPETQIVFADLERRVRLSASISDALFGFTAAPAPIAARLRTLCRAMIQSLATGDQAITWDVAASGACPETQATTVLRVAHEMLGNALRHGFAGRASGRIHVTLTTRAHEIRLVVSDDGNGLEARGGVGQGLRLMEALARAEGGHISLRRRAGFTLAELEMPRR